MFIGFMAITHAVLATAGVCLLLGSADPLVLGLAIIGSQLPDLDTSTSLIGQVFFPLSSFIEDRFPHRTITHCLLTTGGLALISLTVSYFVRQKIDEVALALPLGHLISCFSDTFTKQGVQLFFPMPAWCVSTSNPRRRLETGKAGEYWVLAVATAVLAISVSLASMGGAGEAIGSSLGLKDAIVKTYNQKASTHHVVANVKGYRASDRSLVNQQFVIIAATPGGEFVLSDGDSIYITGQQIITEKVNVEAKQKATTTIKTLTFDDEPILPKLQLIQQQYPHSDIFLTGKISVDLPEEISPEFSANEHQTLTVNTSNVTLDFLKIESALTYLIDQYAIGTIQAKIITPSP